MISNSEIEHFLNEHFDNTMLAPSDKPIRNSVHCVDYNINGAEVRCRWFSPASQGGKVFITYHPLTEEQKAEVKRTKEEFELKDFVDQERRKRIQEYNTNRLLGYTPQKAEPTRKSKITNFLLDS